MVLTPEADDGIEGLLGTGTDVRRGLTQALGWLDLIREDQAAKLPGASNRMASHPGKGCGRASIVTGPILAAQA